MAFRERISGFILPATVIGVLAALALGVYLVVGWILSPKVLAEGKIRNLVTKPGTNVTLAAPAYFRLYENYLIIDNANNVTIIIPREHLMAIDY